MKADTIDSSTCFLNLFLEILCSFTFQFVIISCLKRCSEPFSEHPFVKKFPRGVCLQTPTWLCTTHWQPKTKVLTLSTLQLKKLSTAMQWSDQTVPRLWHTGGKDSEVIEWCLGSGTLAGRTVIKRCLGYAHWRGGQWSDPIMPRFCYTSGEDSEAIEWCLGSSTLMVRYDGCQYRI